MQHAAGPALSAARLVYDGPGSAAPGRDPRLILGQRPAHRASRPQGPNYKQWTSSITSDQTRLVLEKVPSEGSPPRSLNVKLGRQRKGHKGWAGWLA